MYKMSFNNQLDLIALDFVNGDKGLLYLRYVGPETLVNAAWAYLVSKDTRENSWSSKVEIECPERKGCTLSKGVRYKTLKTQLPSQYLDMCLIHPNLTVAQDTPDEGFYLLTYDDGIPRGFYERLNRTLDIPLKPEWTDWLWTDGQEQQSFSWQVIRSVYEDRAYIKKEVEEDDSATPIILHKSLGSVKCFEVRTSQRYKHAWHAAIKNRLNGVTSLPDLHRK